MVHRFISLGRRYDFSEEELFFLHYKLPSSHPEQRDHFEERDNGIPSEWLDELRASGGPYCEPVEAQRSEPRMEAHHGGTNGVLRQMSDRLESRHTRHQAGATP